MKIFPQVLLSLTSWTYKPLWILAGILYFFGACSNPRSPQTKSPDTSPPTQLLAYTQAPPQDTSRVYREFLQHFPDTNLPVEIRIPEILKDTMPADMVVKYILEAAETAKIPTFLEYWGDAESQALTREGLQNRYINIDNSIFAVINFAYGKRINLHPDFYSVWFLCSPTFLEGSYAYAYLANYNPEGQMLDAMLVAEELTYVDMETQSSTLIDQDTSITVSGQVSKYAELYGGTEDFIERFETRYRLSEAGTFETQKQYFSDLSGNYQSPDTNIVIHLDVYHENLFLSFGNPAIAEPGPEWKVIRFDREGRIILAQPPQSSEAYTLRFDDSHSELICQTPEGLTYTYTRTFE